MLRTSVPLIGALTVADAGNTKGMVGQRKDSSGVRMETYG